MTTEKRGRKPKSKYAAELSKPEKRRSVLEVDAGDFLTDKKVFERWTEANTPERQKRTVAPDDVIEEANREIQIQLKQKYPDGSVTLAFWDDAERPEDNDFEICVVEDKPFQVVCAARGNTAVTKGLDWDSLRPPEQVAKIKDLIREYNQKPTKNQGVDDKKKNVIRAEIFRRLSKLFAEMAKPK